MDDQVRAAIRFRSAFAAAGVEKEAAIEAAAAAVRKQERDDAESSGGVNEFESDFDSDSDVR